MKLVDHDAQQFLIKLNDRFPEKCEILKYCTSVFCSLGKYADVNKFGLLNRYNFYGDSGELSFSVLPDGLCDNEYLCNRNIGIYFELRNTHTENIINSDFDDLGFVIVFENIYNLTIEEFYAKIISSR